MPNTIEWPGVTSTPKARPLEHLDPLIAIFHDLRRHPELDGTMEHLAAAIRGVEAHARPERPTFAGDFPARAGS